MAYPLIFCLLFIPEMACASASSSLSNTVFRVRRKRNADPHEALLVSLKRPRMNAPSKPYAPMLYQLATTSEVPEVAAIGKLTPGTKLNIIDFNPSSKLLPNGSQHSSSEKNLEQNPLHVLNDAVGEIGAVEKQKSKLQDHNEQFLLNGAPMACVDVSSHEPDGFVFDFYWNGHGIDYDADQFEVRPARPEELELYAGEDTESSTGADDDDDSNREDNWRNDYPDEESDENSDVDTDDDAQFDSGSESFADLNRRFNECEFCDSDKDTYG